MLETTLERLTTQIIRFKVLWAMLQPLYETLA